MIKRQVVSVSLPKSSLKTLNKLVKEKKQSRSQVIREMIDKYKKEIMWEKIFDLGKTTAKKFNIKTEEDVLRIINE